MTEIKQELSLDDNEGEWEMIYTEHDHLWYKLKQNRFLPEGEYLKPSPYEILKFLKEKYKYRYLVPSVSLFENNNGLSTQVPMKHIYYTECEKLLEWNQHLGYVQVRYFEEAWELERLQRLVLQVNKNTK